MALLSAGPFVWSISAAEERWLFDALDALPHMRFSSEDAEVSVSRSWKFDPVMLDYAVLAGSVRLPRPTRPGLARLLRSAGWALTALQIFRLKERGVSWTSVARCYLFLATAPRRYT